MAVLLSAAHYLGLIVAATALVWLLLHSGALASRILLGGLIFSGFAWLAAFFKRRSTLCPLCKGTPLLNGGALPHVRAWRIWPFNHGTTATLSIIACQKFRCMYCGSDFDLLKPRTKILYGESPDPESED